MKSAAEIAQSGVNYVALTGTLTAEPKEGRGPTGKPVTLLRLEFAVVDPDRPQALWRWASCGVEVATEADRRRASKLRGGSRILVAGQVGERWVVEGGRSCRSGFLLASLVHPECTQSQVADLLLPSDLS